MPTYQYACKQPACGHRFEAVQSFSDDPLTTCPVCEGQVRKVFSAVGVVFKGSGFYRTDSREAPKSSSSTEKNGASKDNGSGTGSGSGAGEKKAESASSSSSSGSGSSGTGSSGSGSSGSSSGSTSSAAAS